MPADQHPRVYVHGIDRKCTALNANRKRTALNRLAPDRKRTALSGTFTRAICTRASTYARAECQDGGGINGGAGSPAARTRGAACL